MSESLVIKINNKFALSLCGCLVVANIQEYDVLHYEFIEICVRLMKTFNKLMSTYNSTCRAINKYNKYTIHCVLYLIFSSVSQILVLLY